MSTCMFGRLAGWVSFEILELSFLKRQEDEEEQKARGGGGALGKQGKGAREQEKEEEGGKQGKAFFSLDCGGYEEKLFIIFCPVCLSVSLCI